MGIWLQYLLPQRQFIICRKMLTVLLVQMVYTM